MRKPAKAAGTIHFLFPNSDESFSSALDKSAGFSGAVPGAAAGAAAWASASSFRSSTFGAATGAAYGALAEYLPTVTSKDGANFGMALVTLTHQGALPMMGLAARPGEQTAREKTSEMTSHIVYGVVTETVRRLVRRML